MNQAALERAPRPYRLPLRRLPGPILFFAVAFAIDQATGQRASSVIGSTAIVLSLVWVFPGVIRSLRALGAYAACWLVFNIGRAVADGSPLALADAGLVARLEARVFGGELPSALMQRWLPSGVIGDVVTGVAAAVHLSFFVVPFVVGVLLWRTARPRFATYTLATAVTFAMALVGFFLLPTAPPWLADPDGTARLVRDLLPGGAFGTGGADGDGGLRFEPNHLAALPSVHVAAAALVALVARPWGGIRAALATAYAVAMSGAVVVLGEHYVADVGLGWGVAMVAWRAVTSPRRAAAGDKPAGAAGVSRSRLARY